MRSEPDAATQALIRSLTGVRPAALFLDVDGTLLDIAPRPDAVHVPASLRTALARLHAGLDGALALVSGRPVAELDRIFAPLRLPAAGSHGAHWRANADAPIEHLAGAILPQAVRKALLALRESHPGLIVEDKSSSIAIHFRDRPELARTLDEAITRILADSRNEPITLLPGKAVLEVKRTGFDKARAIRILMASPAFAGRQPIFIGDDITDQVALDAVAAAGGTALSVERPIGRAREVFASAAAVRTAIERAAALMETRPWTSAS